MTQYLYGGVEGRGERARGIKVKRSDRRVSTLRTSPQNQSGKCVRSGCSKLPDNCLWALFLRELIIIFGLTILLVLLFMFLDNINAIVFLHDN